MNEIWRIIVDKEQERAKELVDEFKENEGEGSEIIFLLKMDKFEKEKEE